MTEGKLISKHPAVILLAIYFIVLTTGTRRNNYEHKTRIKK
jgi:hypothetical protein